MTKRSAPDRLGIFERAMFSFMGPPQLGENRVREGYIPDTAATRCHRCRQPWADHERVNTGRFAYRRCVDSQT